MSFYNDIIRVCVCSSMRVCYYLNYAMLLRGVAMIDFHSHILPGIDDGSHNAEESIELLKLLHTQGVTSVVATPHFYANEQSVEVFLQRRSKAYDRLLEQCAEDVPQIRLGAEVLYYNGISRLEGLEKLCIDGTSVLLLEMPFTRWSSTVLREVLEMANNMGLTIVLAHIERYMRFQRSGVFEELMRNGVRMQVNASYFVEHMTRRAALRQLRTGQIHLLGSDCHGIENRPPRLDAAAAVITKKYGAELLQELNGCAQSLLLQ